MLLIWGLRQHRRRATD